MSYDLNFWKYKEGVYLDNQEVYERASNEELVEGLESIPVKEIVEKILEVYRHWQTDDKDSWKNPEGKGAFQIMTTPQFIRIDCYGIGGNDMNKFIDILLEYDCPLYDPQVRKRFDGKP